MKWEMTRTFGGRKLIVTAALPDEFEKARPLAKAKTYITLSKLCEELASYFHFQADLHSIDADDQTTN